MVMLKSIQLLVLVGLASLAASGCSESRRAWSAAADTDTIEAYEQFLAEFPAAGKAAAAKARLQQLKFPLADAGLPTIERIPDRPFACADGDARAKEARGVAYVAREETSLTTEQLREYFGVAAQGRMFRAGEAMTGAMPRSGGTVYFGDMCFAYNGTAAKVVQVTGSFVSNSAGWTLSKGTQITVARDADPVRDGASAK